MSNVAVILGAGNSTRMKTEKSKLLLKINGQTVIERSVNAFLNISDIDEIIVVARQQDIEAFSSILDDERISFVVGAWSVRFSTQAFSQRAGQMRPVNSGKSFVPSL